MPISDSKHLHVESLLAVLAGLSIAACEKTRGEVAPEPAPASSAQAQQKTGAPAGEGPVQGKEVPAAASSGSGQVQMTCAPGGCAPGKCGGAKPSENEK